MSLVSSVYNGAIPASSRRQNTSAPHVATCLAMEIGEKRTWTLPEEDGTRLALNFRSTLWHGLRKKGNLHLNYTLVARENIVYVQRDK